MTNEVRIHPDTKRCNSLQLALMIAEARIRTLEAEVKALREQVKA
jgi:hypothetical protein